MQMISFVNSCRIRCVLYANGLRECSFVTPVCLIGGRDSFPITLIAVVGYAAPPRCLHAPSQTREATTHFQSPAKQIRAIEKAASRIGNVFRPGSSCS